MTGAGPQHFSISSEYLSEVEGMAQEKSLVGSSYWPVVPQVVVLDMFDGVL